MSTATNVALNSRSLNGIIVVSDGTATLEDGDLNCEDINSSSLNTSTINTNLLTCLGKFDCNLNGPYTIPTSISNATGLLISYGNVSNSGATDFTNFGSTYTSTKQGFRFFNKSNVQTLTNLAIIDNTQTYFSSPLTGCLAETPLNTTSVVNKTYVDSNFLDRTNNLTQNINGLKTFTNDTTFNAQARFDNFTPTCTVAIPTQINHLTRKDYVDSNFVYKTGTVNETITGSKTFGNSCTAGINFTVNTALICNTLNARNPSVNVARELWTNLTTASTITIGTNNTPITVNSTTISVNGDTTFNNNLTSSAQATFSNFCPISNTNATLTNHLTTLGFNNGKYIDFTTDQTISGTKRFNTIFTQEHSWATSTFTNRVQSYISGNYLVFMPQFNNNQYLFHCKDSVPNLTNPLTIDSTNTTIANNLISNSQATFSNFCPISNTNATLTNHLTTLGFNNGKYIDFLTDQTILNDKRFGGLWATNFNITETLGGGGNRVQISQVGTTLQFVPVYNNQIYKFYVSNATGGQINSLQTDYNYTTINNYLICNSEAFFNTWVNLKFRTRIYDISSGTNYTQMYMLSGNTFIIAPDGNGDVIAFFCKDAILGQLQTFTSSALGNTSNVKLTCSSSLVSNNLTAPTTTSINNIYTTLVSGGSINIGGLLSANYIFGPTEFSSAATFNLGATFLGISTFFNSGTYSEIEQTTGSNLVIRNTTNARKVILSTTSSSTGQVDSLAITTSSCDILPSTLNLNSSSTINILTPNNLTGVINFLSTLTTATVNFCSTTYTSILYLNARLLHKQVQYQNEIKTISGTALTLVFPLEQRWQFTSTGATQIVIDLPELTTSYQAGFYFSLFKTASTTNSVKINRQGSNVIRSYNSITNLTTDTILSGTGTSVSIITAEISGVFSWIVTA